jgi:hypothetical protein
MAAPPQITYDAYWAIETMADLDRDKPAAWVEAVIARCKDILLEVEM